MTRRSFLQALFAIPVLAAPLLVPTVAKAPEQWTTWGMDWGSSDKACAVELHYDAGTWTLHRVEWDPNKVMWFTPEMLPPGATL